MRCRRHALPLWKCGRFKNKKHVRVALFRGQVKVRVLTKGTPLMPKQISFDPITQFQADALVYFEGQKDYPAGFYALTGKHWLRYNRPFADGNIKNGLSVREEEDVLKRIFPRYFRDYWSAFITNEDQPFAEWLRASRVIRGTLG
jgi:hypothetical protein